MRRNWFWISWATWLVLCAGCQPAAQQVQSDRLSSSTDATTAESADVDVETEELNGDVVVASADSEATQVVPVDPESDLPGLPIGYKAPDFALRNQADESIRLSDLLQENNVAIVFYRSADW